MYIVHRSVKTTSINHSVRPRRSNSGLVLSAVASFKLSRGLIPVYMRVRGAPGRQTTSANPSVETGRGDSGLMLSAVCDFSILSL